MNVIRKGLRRSLRNVVFLANALAGSYQEVIWLLGVGRSGTTWTASLLNYHGRYRQMFEPFHLRRVSAARHWPPHHYLPPGSREDALTRVFGRIFRGFFWHPRVDFQNGVFPLRHRGLVVKDIFANLVCHGVCRRFPRVRPVLLLRNPFAVALSKAKRRDWYWFDDPLALLDRDALVSDHLGPFTTAIERVGSEGDFLERQVLLWAILNYVPLRQFEKSQLHVAFYENLTESPEQEALQVLRFVRNQPDLQLSIPVRQSAQSSLLSGQSWREELTPRQKAKGLAILAEFGLGGLYQDGRPNPDALDAVRRRC